MAFGGGSADGPFAELRRRRVLRALAAYIVVGWILLQVADVTFEPLGLPHWAQRALIIAVVAGIVPAAVLAWVYDLTRHGVVRTPSAGRDDADARGPALAQPRLANDEGRVGSGEGVAGSAATAATEVAPIAATDAAPAGPASPIAAIAVLPFTDLSQARDHDWFCDGLAEEIIDSLCCVRGLRVASRTASFRFRDGSTDPREIGRLLSVDAILEGSVRVAGERLRVTAQLIDARDGYHAWSETYERAVTDVFAIQREIAENVARALKLSVAGRAAQARGQHAPRSMEAYEAYLRGRQLVSVFQKSSILRAPAYFRQAIALDPGYAQAWAGLADALAQQAQWRFAPAARVVPEGAAAANRAIDLAPDLAEAHVAQGSLRSVAGDADGARRAFERALELNPALFDAWHYYARDCYSRGEYARAAELFQRAHRARPDDFTPLVFAGSSLLALGDKAGSDALAARAANGLVQQVALEPDNLRAHYLASGALHQVGRTGEGRRLIDLALQRAPDDFSTLYNGACFYSLTGDHDRALDLLERALGQGGGFPDWLRHDTDLDALRELPRFQALMARMSGGEVSGQRTEVSGQDAEADSDARDPP
jgi:adenylate cyclase